MNDDLLNDFLLEAFPNPERKGCPDEKTLRALAENRLAPGHPTLQHVGSCSECYAEYRHYRRDWKESGSNSAYGATPAPVSEPAPLLVSTRAASPPAARSKALPWSVAAGVLVVLGGGFYLAREHHAPASAGALVVSSTGPVSATVDLFSAVTVRGGGGDEPTPLQPQVSLPSAIVHLSVTLPRFSQSGPYEILVSKDRAGLDRVAHGTGNAVEADGKVSLVVTLDLRNTHPGMYFLATVRGSDNGTYYYPLKVN